MLPIPHGCPASAVRALVGGIALGIGSLAGAADEPPGSFLVVHPPALADVADAWRDYRAGQGWIAETIEVDGLGRASVRDRILERAEDPHASGHAVFVLLLGDTDVLPTWTFEQADHTLRSRGDSRYASDDPYQHVDDDRRPDLALGRVPARTSAEATSVLAKIRAYESSDRVDDPARRRVTFVAGEGRFGPYDLLLETLFRSMVERTVPPPFDVSMTYAKPTSIYCPPPSQLATTCLERLGEGALLFNYVGHGSARGFDRLIWGGQAPRILAVEDLDALEPGPGPRPVALLTCCSTGWYDRADGKPSMAEALLLHPAGPVAVVAGSRITHPYASVILQNDFTRLLLVERRDTIGAIDLEAMRSMVTIDADDRAIDLLASPIARFGGWPSTLGELRRMHVRLYNLLGDPATRIAHPGPPAANARLVGERLVVSFDDLAEGTATITVETSIASCRDAATLEPTSGADAPALEERATFNYPRVNDRILHRATAPVTAGRLEVDLPLCELGRHGRIVKLAASGTNARGRTVAATAAVAIIQPCPPNDPSPVSRSPMAPSSPGGRSAPVPTP